MVVFYLFYICSNLFHLIAFYFSILGRLPDMADPEAIIWSLAAPATIGTPRSCCHCIVSWLYIVAVDVAGIASEPVPSKHW